MLSKFDQEAKPHEKAAAEEVQDATQRRCIASRLVQDKAQMLRFVLDPEGNLVFDHNERLPGRGLWVAVDQLDRAIQSRSFARAAKAQCNIAPDLKAKVEFILTQSLLQQLSMARKRGALVLGREKIAAAMIKHRSGLLMLAKDIGQDSQKLYRPDLHAGAIRTLPFSNVELAAALARSHVAAIYVCEQLTLQRKLLTCINKLEALVQG